MNIFDIFVAYVSWGDGGKIRPVLVLEEKESVISVFKITTQYENKSKAVRTKYFKINDWQQAGLNLQSYVDTNSIWDIPSLAFDKKSKIGKLSAADELSLVEFISS